MRCTPAATGAPSRRARSQVCASVSARTSSGRRSRAATRLWCCVSDPGLAGGQLVRMQLDRRHRRPHAHLDLDATLERVARRVEVEREVHAHRHHGFRQMTRHLVEAEARLRPGGSRAEQQAGDCGRSSHAAGKLKAYKHDSPPATMRFSGGRAKRPGNCAHHLPAARRVPVRALGATQRSRSSRASGAGRTRAIAAGYRIATFGEEFSPWSMAPALVAGQLH